MKLRKAKNASILHTRFPLTNHYCYEFVIIHWLVNTAKRARVHRQNRKSSLRYETELRKFTYECLISRIRPRDKRATWRHGIRARLNVTCYRATCHANYPCQLREWRGWGENPSNGVDPKSSWRASILFLIAVTQRHRAPKIAIHRNIFRAPRTIWRKIRRAKRDTSL